MAVLLLLFTSSIAHAGTIDQFTLSVLYQAVPPALIGPADYETIQFDLPPNITAINPSASVPVTFSLGGVSGATVLFPLSINNPFQYLVVASLPSGLSIDLNCGAVDVQGCQLNGPDELLFTGPFLGAVNAQGAFNGGTYVSTTSNIIPFPDTGDCTSNPLASQPLTSACYPTLTIAAVSTPEPGTVGLLTIGLLGLALLTLRRENQVHSRYSRIKAM
jgi:hypothetical protein